MVIKFESSFLSFEISVKRSTNDDPISQGTVEKCIRIAMDAHEGQRDRDGNAVILHPLIVGGMGKTDAEKCEGFLHDVIEDTDARQILTNLTDLADNGKIDEAENQLYEMTCDGDRQNLEIGLLFYYHLNGKDDEFLEASNFSREEIMMGIQDLAERYNLSGIAEAFRTEIL